MAWMSYHIPLFYVDGITYPCPKLIFQTEHIRNVYRVRGEGHYYDIISKPCDVTITMS